MNIKYYNIAHKSDLSSIDMPIDRLRVVFICENIPKKTDSDVLLQNILKSIHAQDTNHHAILTLQDFIGLSDVLLDSNQDILILAMGITPKELGWQVNHLAYEMIQIRQLKLIFTHNIEALSANKEYKIRLWSILKGLA